MIIKRLILFAILSVYLALGPNLARAESLEEAKAKLTGTWVINFDASQKQSADRSAIGGLDAEAIKNASRVLYTYNEDGTFVETLSGEDLTGTYSISTDSDGGLILSIVGQSNSPISFHLTFDSETPILSSMAKSPDGETVPKSVTVLRRK